MVKTGEAAPFIQHTYNQVIQYISNRDLIKLEEKHIKMIMMSFLSITQAYIPYSELEMWDFFLKTKKFLAVLKKLNCTQIRY